MIERTSITRRGLLALAAAVAGLGISPAYTSAEPTSDELQAQLDAARSELETIGAELQTLQETLISAEASLDETQGLISETQTQIDATTEELSSKKSELASLMASSYKKGGDSLEGLSYILGATSAEDLVSRVYYMDKVSTAKAEVIESVKTLGAQLESQKSDLEDQEAAQEAELAATQTSVDEYETKVASAQSYISNLDTQVQEALAAEAAAAEEERQRALAAALEAAEQEKAKQEREAQDANSSDSTDSNNSNNSNNTGNNTDANKADNGGSGSSSNSGNNSSSNSGSGASDGSVVSYAASLIGKPYIWGNYGPNASGYDCCGLVATAYHMAGYSTPPYATNVPGIISVIKSRGNWKDCDLSNYQSVLNVGDVIACSTGHVAIYAGGNQMIHANHPGGSVVQSYVYACIGGGFGG